MHRLAATSHHCMILKVSCNVGFAHAQKDTTHRRIMVGGMQKVGDVRRVGIHSPPGKHIQRCHYSSGVLIR